MLNYSVAELRVNLPRIYINEQKTTSSDGYGVDFNTHHHGSDHYLRP